METTSPRSILSFVLGRSDLLFDSGTCVLMPGTLATDWEKERKRERWIVIHRKSIGIPRGLPSLLIYIYVFISLLTSNPMLIRKTSDC
ncbi:hypothetical protein HanRHA438_Chr08g0357311 [Helianthus annuus]|nr:hypothetical protein HanRHA438_Chr08g0357311 [Helianthus annuus]